MSPLKNHFYISLDTEKERKIFMEAQFKKIGIMERTIRFPAIDAKSPDALANTNYKLGGWRPRWSLTPTEIAIFESHRALWQNIINEGLDFAIIMEDDIFISKEIVTTQHGYPLDSLHIIRGRKLVNKRCFYANLSTAIN